MTPFNSQYLASFWTLPMMGVNLLVFLNLAGAMALGLLVGYERSYHGRAAGMRTYGIVCMASAALTIFAGYPGYWWGAMVAKPCCMLIPHVLCKASSPAWVF